LRVTSTDVLVPWVGIEPTTRDAQSRTRTTRPGVIQQEYNITNALAATHNRRAPWLIDQAASTMHHLVAVVLPPAATTATDSKCAP
jgi:hypothetical protein